MNDFLEEQKHSIYIPIINSGERIDLPIWVIHDLIKEKGIGEICLMANRVDNDGNVIPVINKQLTYMCIDDGQLSSAGELGPSEEIYGAKIDTSNELIYKNIVSPNVQRRKNRVINIFSG